jgi:hypothetical protein
MVMIAKVAITKARKHKKKILAENNELKVRPRI